MNIQKLSTKQRKLLRWCHKAGGFDNIICDGAVRSGKTVIMAISFVHWAMRYFAGQNFAFCSKTVKTCERNVIMPLLSCGDITDFFDLTYKRSDGVLIIKNGNRKNTFYLFGGKDESSFALIQGITLAGVMFDETTLLPKNFVNQAVARTLSVKGAKLWFNCNPEGPNHWFYNEWLKECEGANLKNCLHLHFTMEDNPILSAAQIEKAKRLYTGVFYKRYILGLWVAAEGLIYPDIDPVIVKDAPLPKNCMRLMVGMDFGGNRSLTTLVACAITENFDSITALCDFAINGKKGEIDAARICECTEEFIKNIYRKYGRYPDEIRCDSAEQYLIATLKNHLIKKGFNIAVKDSDKGEILQRIRCTCSLISNRKLTINSDCHLLINGLKSAVWDQKAAAKGKDVRLDDFTSDIDILDAFEYSFSPYIARFTPRQERNFKDGGGGVTARDFKGYWF